MTSKYQHGYSYDFFVSYSSRNQAWVEKFVGDLVEDVNRFADHDVVHFMDKARLQAGYVWDQALVSAVRNSAILLPVLSPRFFQSDYCQKEVNAFVEVFGLNSGSPHRSRILTVKLLCSAPKDHLLAEVQETPFCSEGADGMPIEYQPGTAPYVEGVRKLAYAIAQLLKNVPPQKQHKSAVYVAADFQPETGKLRASLSHKFDTLPGDPNALVRMTAQELEQALARDLSRCFVSVHALTDAPLTKALQEAQISAARKQSKPRLILAASAAADLMNEGFEWFTSRAEVEDRIQRLWEKPPEVKTLGRERLIYFVCPDRNNKNNAEPLLATLEKRGIHVYPSPLDGPADQALQTHVQALDELDGCLIYYGEIGREWFDAVFLRILKKIRQRGLPSAIFVAPPDTEHKTEDLCRLGVPPVVEAEAAVSAFLPLGAVGI